MKVQRLFKIEGVNWRYCTLRNVESFGAKWKK